MGNEPDYRGYTLDELEDAARHIDAAARPERAARLAAEISARSDERARRKWDRARAERAAVLSTKSLGILLAVSGVVTLATTLDSINGAPKTVVVLVVLAIYGSLSLAGVLLILRWRPALWLGLVVMMVHLPILQIWRLRYVVTFFPAAELRLWPPLVVTVTTGHKIDLRYFDAAQPTYVGINLTAALILGFLAWHVERARAARRRLSARAAPIAPASR